MKPNQLTLNKHYEGTSVETWSIDAVGNCGEYVFPKVIVVKEPKSVNPGIYMEKTFGLNGLKRAIKLIEGERKRLGVVVKK